MTVPVDVVPEPGKADKAVEPPASPLIPQRSTTIRTGPPTMGDVGIETDGGQTSPPNGKAPRKPAVPPVPPLTVGLEVKGDDHTRAFEEHEEVSEEQELNIDDLEEIADASAMPPPALPNDRQDLPSPPSSPSSELKVDDSVDGDGAPPDTTDDQEEEGLKSGKSIDIMVDELGEEEEETADETEEEEEDEDEDEDDLEENFEDAPTIRRTSPSLRARLAAARAEMEKVSPLAFPPAIAREVEKEPPPKDEDHVEAGPSSERSAETKNDDDLEERSSEPPLLDLETGEIASASTSRSTKAGGKATKKTARVEDDDSTPEGQDTEATASDSLKPPGSVQASDGAEDDSGESDGEQLGSVDEKGDVDELRDTLTQDVSPDLKDKGPARSKTLADGEGGAEESPVEDQVDGQKSSKDDQSAGDSAKGMLFNESSVDVDPLSGEWEDLTHRPEEVAGTATDSGDEEDERSKQSEEKPPAEIDELLATLDEPLEELEEVSDEFSGDLDESALESDESEQEDSAAAAAEAETKAAAAEVVARLPKPEPRAIERDDDLDDDDIEEDEESSYDDEDGQAEGHDEALKADDVPEKVDADEGTKVEPSAEPEEVEKAAKIDGRDEAEPRDEAESSEAREDADLAAKGEPLGEKETTGDGKAVPETEEASEGEEAGTSTDTIAAVTEEDGQEPDVTSKAQPRADDISESTRTALDEPDASPAKPALFAESHKVPADDGVQADELDVEDMSAKIGGELEETEPEAKPPIVPVVDDDEGPAEPVLVGVIQVIGQGVPEVADEVEPEEVEIDIFKDSDSEDDFESTNLFVPPPPPHIPPSTDSSDADLFDDDIGEDFDTRVTLVRRPIDVDDEAAEALTLPDIDEVEIEASVVDREAALNSEATPSDQRKELAPPPPPPQDGVSSDVKEAPEEGAEVGTDSAAKVGAQSDGTETEAGALGSESLDEDAEELDLSEAVEVKDSRGSLNLVQDSQGGAATPSKASPVPSGPPKVSPPPPAPPSAPPAGGPPPPPAPPLVQGPYRSADGIPDIPDMPDMPLDEGRPSRRKRRKPWWEEIFNDDYLRSLPRYSQRQTQKEVDFIVSALGIKAGGMILDLACGNGRHSVELSSRGFQVVGLDLSLPMLARAAELAQKHDQKINFIHGDMRQIAFESTFDGACCFGTSFGFFDDETNIKAIEGVRRSLKSRGTLIIDMVNRDYLINHQPNMLWFEGDGCVCMEESSFNFITSRLKVKRTLLFEGGRQVDQEFSLRVYCLHEIGKLLHNAGFRVVEVSGHIHTPGAFFGPDSTNLIILAEKRAE